MQRSHRALATIMLIVVGLATAGAVNGQPEQGTWSVSPVLGVHAPSLDGLNEGEFRSPFEGTADIIDELGFNESTEFTFRNPLPPIESGAVTGLEFQWRLNDRHAFIVGMSSWEGTSSASNQSEFPLQGSFERVTNQREGRFSYNEFFLGWRWDVFKREKSNFYLRLTAHELFDIDYREDFSFVFLSGPPQSFRRSIIIQSQTTGVLMFQLGGGGEWFIKDWLSVGAEAGWMFATDDFALQDGDLQTDFRDNDNLFLEMPLIPSPNGNMFFKTEDGSEYQELNLRMDGWKALLRVNIYY